MWWFALIFALLGAARADRYWDPDALAADAFPTADSLQTVTLKLSDADRQALKSRVGRPIAKDSYDFLVAREGGVVQGYLLFDEQKGQHEPISFAVQLSPQAVVLRQEVVVYRERYGFEVADSRFRSQFVGRTSADALKPGQDVDVVSGATISSVAMTLGVKRAIALTELLIERSGSEGS